MSATVLPSIFLFRLPSFWSFVLGFFVALHPVARSRAQLSYPSCTDTTDWSWASNSLNQNPCEVGAYLEAVCNSGQFTIPTLITGNHYTGPTAADGSNQCKCNTVVYSLVSACGGCQGGEWIQWSEWSLNCTAVGSDGTLPISIPSGTRVPGWAYLTVEAADSFDNTSAKADASAPESTAASGQSTISGTATSSSQTSSSATSSSSTTTSAAAAQTTAATVSSHSSNAGAIAGGVVGGVVGLGLLVAGVVWFVMRRRKAGAFGRPNYSAAPTTDDGHSAAGRYTDEAGVMGTTHSPSTEGGIPMKYYDPSDPTTFPTTSSATSPHPSAPAPSIYTTNTTGQPAGRPFSEGHSTYGAASRYSGLPEV